MNVLTLSDINISLDGRALVTFDGSVQGGEILTVMGPSGSGKSSLLAYIGGFLDPVFAASGQVVLNERPLTHLPTNERETGILFQDPLLFPHMSAGENLLFALPAGGTKKQRWARAQEALEEVGLEGFGDRDPATLSGGQKARVALMRVLLSEPSALLLDEPFSKLDIDRRDQIRSLVFGLARNKGLPTLLVTHDQADADAAAGDCIYLS